MAASALHDGKEAPSAELGDGLDRCEDILHRERSYAGVFNVGDHQAARWDVDSAAPSTGRPLEQVQAVVLEQVEAPVRVDVAVTPVELTAGRLERREVDGGMCPRRRFARSLLPARRECCRRARTRRARDTTKSNPSRTPRIEVAATPPARSPPAAKSATGSPAGPRITWCGAGNQQWQRRGGQPPWETSAHSP